MHSFLIRLQLLVSLLLVLLLVATTTSILATSSDDDAAGNTNDNNVKKHDAAKCRELGFASPGTSRPPSCGTCDVLAELLRASPEEKASQTPEQRAETKAQKKQLVRECRECCTPGNFEDDDATAVQQQQQRLLAQQMGGVSGGEAPLPGKFVSAVLEVDESIAKNTAHPISKFIKNYGSQWDANKMAVRYKELMAPRLVLVREDSTASSGGKEDIINVGSWEPELIWEYLRRNLAS